jgi:predicted metal-dependent hydrolase
MKLLWLQEKYSDVKIDNLIRSSRRSVSLEIRGNGELVVRAPLRLVYSAILDIIKKKAKWIEEKRQCIRSREIPTDNEKYFLGQKLNVITVPGEKASVSYDKNNFFITLSQHRTIKALLSRWYKQKTFEIVIPRTVKFAKAFGLKVAKISISTANRKWGSCNRKGYVTFSFRLVMLPMEIIDYIIIHELAHLVEFNHSKQFWTAVHKMMPGYQQHEQWLKQNSYKFSL